METLKRFVEMNSITDLSDVNIFKINHSFSREFSMVLDGKFNKLSEDFSLPFRKCFVSFKKSYIVQMGNMSITSDSLMVEEVSPTELMVKLCIRGYNGIKEEWNWVTYKYENGAPVVDDIPSYIEIRGMTTTIFNVITSVLNELCSRKYVYVENDEQVDIKFRSKVNRKLVRVKYRPKMIIYISDKKTFKNEHPELSGRIISKPSFAYECMGHYRKLHCEDWFGHDRQGNIVQGWTYVNPHVRCADRGELIKKIRVIR